MIDAFNYDRVERMTIVESSDNDLEPMKLNNAWDVLEQLQQLLDSSGNEKNGCRCYGLTCQCCQYVNIPRLPFHNLCLSLTLCPSRASLVIQMKVDGRVLFNQEFSVRHPISLCTPIPFTPAKLCLNLHDIHFDSRTFSGCSQVSAYLFGFKLFGAELGCMHIHYRDSSKTSQFAETRIVEAAAILETSDGAYLKKVIPIGNIEDASEDDKI